MTRKCALLFCDNEHGTGDVTFPDINAMTSDEINQVFIQSPTTKMLRSEAKLAGWGKVNGGDYCPACMEGMES